MNPLNTPGSKPALSAENKNNIQQMLIQGLDLHKQGQLQDAFVLYQKILAIQPDNFDALHLSGIYHSQIAQYPRAIEFINQAISVNPNIAHAYSTLGNVLKEAKQLDKAIENYNKAILLNPDFADAYSNRGNVFKELKQMSVAFADYDKAISINPLHVDAYINRGVAFAEEKKLDAAIASYDKAIEIQPDNADAYTNRGAALAELKKLEEAVASYDKAIVFKPNNPKTYYNRGTALAALKKLDAAADSYEKAITLKPDYDFLFGTLLHTRMHLCIWKDFDANLKKISEQIQNKQKASTCFALVALMDSLPLQQIVAQTWVGVKCPPNDKLGPIARRKKQDKIRIAYYTADFRNHPVAFLMAGLFEAHDKNKFELFAFTFDVDSQDKMRQRISKAFDHFIDVRAKSDVEVAQLSRDLGIDIAIDLGGQTANCRTGIFALRAAPIQVSYIGYLGTMGADYFDYLFADKTIIPEAAKKYYSEKIVYLQSYQVNDDKRTVVNKKNSRQELGLPPTGFVFCCFNNTYKITPATFDGWMRILKQVPGSVLLLYVGQEAAKINLQNEASSRGVDPSRIIFGGRVPFLQYMARFTVADLFLDTQPYNAGTTASDALWMGVPVLTCIGQSFAARMAASLLNAIDLPELITHSAQEYEDKAIELATNPQKLAAIKDKLEKNKLSKPLFNTKQFTQHIEKAYTAMYDRYHANLAPDDIDTESAIKDATTPIKNSLNLQKIFDQGLALHQKGELKQAAVLYSQILKIDPDYFDALHLLGVYYSQSKQYEQAVALIFKAIKINPNVAAAYCNLGVALVGLQKIDTAIASYDKAILLNPNFAEAYSNKACALERLNKLELAIESYDKALAIKNDNPKMHYERAVLFTRLRQPDKALLGYYNVYKINPTYPLLLGALLHAKMQICSWGDIDKGVQALTTCIQEDKKVSTCFIVESLIDDPAIQRKSAEIWISSMYPFNNALGAIVKRSPKNKIRIGYYSPDFKNHPVSFLAAGLFEEHDKNKFEVYAFSFGLENQDKIRLRIAAACDKFIDVKDKTDREIAQLSRELEIDIAIDLVGLTADARTGIFAYRVAPVQINYLGYLGSMGAEYFDYLLADKTIIPNAFKKHYVEKIAYLPSYQVNDAKRTVVDLKVSRAELGLPEDAFIFCCLNNTYKITPTVFDSWMRILKRVERGVLLVYADHDNAIINLKKEARARGIDPKRLLFAKHAPFYEYMLRLAAADLFLDTLPYNAGTTASDALWMGLPVLTCMGQSFASRMAASVLTAIKLPELIVDTLEAYENKAVDLANNPKQLAKIKAKLVKHRLSTPLFNTKKFTKDIEKAYTKMYQRYQAGLLADDIDVS